MKVKEAVCSAIAAWERRRRHVGKRGNVTISVRYDSGGTLKKRVRRYWVRPLLQKHDEFGAWATSIRFMKTEDHEKFYETFRMTPKTFDWLVDLVSPFLEKNSWRKCIEPAERVAITLRFLASGNSFKSLEKYFLVAEQTISNIVFETTAVIYQALEPIVFKELNEDTWLQCAAEFEAMWNVPHCLGAIDGKHVTIHAPPLSGSKNYNYKHFFSIILLGICDAKMNFLVVDVGSSGSRGDGNVFHRSKFAKQLREETLKLPPPSNVDGVKLPFYFLGDAAFQRGSHIVTPFKGKFLRPEKRVFNYRVSRGRRQIENAFGMLYKRYEVFQKPLQTSLPNATNIVLCTTALHNLHLMDESSSEPCRRRNRHGEFYDFQKEDGTTVYGRFKGEDPVKEAEVKRRLEEESRLEGTTVSNGQVTEFLVDYFIDHDLQWQWKSAGIASGEFGDPSDDDSSDDDSSDDDSSDDDPCFFL